MIRLFDMLIIPAKYTLRKSYFTFNPYIGSGVLSFAGYKYVTNRGVPPRGRETRDAEGGVPPRERGDTGRRVLSEFMSGFFSC
jgi:hypothetical protein